MSEREGRKALQLTAWNERYAPFCTLTPQAIFTHNAQKVLLAYTKLLSHETILSQRKQQTILDSHPQRFFLKLVHEVGNSDGKGFPVRNTLWYIHIDLLACDTAGLHFHHFGAFLSPSSTKNLNDTNQSERRTKPGIHLPAQC